MYEGPLSQIDYRPYFIFSNLLHEVNGDTGTTYLFSILYMQIRTIDGFLKKRYKRAHTSLTMHQQTDRPLPRPLITHTYYFLPFPIYEIYFMYSTSVCRYHVRQGSSSLGTRGLKGDGFSRQSPSHSV